MPTSTSSTSSSSSSRVVALSILLLLMGISVVLAEGFSILNGGSVVQQQQRRPSLGVFQRVITTTPIGYNNSINKKSPTTTATTTTTTIAVVPRGGAIRYAESSDDDDEKNRGIIGKSISAIGNVWGSLGVVYILAKAIKRVMPIALEPFFHHHSTTTTSLTFSPIQWCLYGATCIFFAYAEGYKGFQLKFSPLVVKRSATLGKTTKNPIYFLLAPLYSMGLICATKKRLITSWSVTMGVTTIVAIVKRLNPVPRCILDAGVVVGLTWGSISILYYFMKSIITGKDDPNVDACLPLSSSSSSGSSSP